MTSPTIPTHTRVIIIGGGIIGCSVAYHLAKLGWRDVLLLERDRLTSGTTWHAAGLLTTLRETETQTHLAKYTQDLYRTLESEVGQATGFVPCGSIQLATTCDRAEEMRRGIQLAASCGVEAHEIDRAEVKRHWPLANVNDLTAAFYFPNDARANPTDVTQALAKGARALGVRIVEQLAVTDITRKNGAVTGVRTPQGEITAEFVVNCAGMWARKIGSMAEVDVPLQAAEHYYLISEPLAGVHPKLPILRDPDHAAYLREETGKILLGIFERVASPWSAAGVQDNFSFGEITPDWDRMAPIIETAMKRVPSLSEAGIKLLFCGPESFTPDHNYLMGEAPNLRRFFVAAGFNSLGILSAGGAGHVIARWIADGSAPMDVWSVNLRRMHAWQNNDCYLWDRTVESLGIGYQNHWPFRQWRTARDVKQSPLHDRIASAGACFGESAGWERANWYAAPGQAAEYQYRWGRQNWFENSAAEHRAVRETVGLFDQSSFAKLLVQGRDAVAVLNRISTAEIDVVIGRSVYTQFLNPRGGIEADLTISRIAEREFLVVTAAFTQTHVQAWISEHIRTDEFCVVTDQTDAYAMVSVQGPSSRDLLQTLAEEDFSLEGFPFATCRKVSFYYQTALALRITYVGELGWELYIPTAFARQLYDSLRRAGAKFGLRHCGYHALNSLRSEKAYREWSHDIGPDDTPLEAGLAFTCAWDKPSGFLGSEALSQRRGAPLKRRLVQFLLSDPEVLLYHHEPIYRDGERVGLITSGSYGHTLGASVGLGYVNHTDGVTREFVESGHFEIQVADRRVCARASLAPLYDPARTRILC